MTVLNEIGQRKQEYRSTELPNWILLNISTTLAARVDFGIGTGDHYGDSNKPTETIHQFFPVHS